MTFKADRMPVVWVADDSAAEAAMAQRALSSDYTVRCFTSGPALIEHISSGEHPDALILDWEMPELSGLEVCQFLRADPATRELPILILTANGRTEDLVRGLAAGANDYVAKPFSSAELTARVAALVRARRMRERAERAERALVDVVENLPDAVVGVDGDGLVRYVNEEGARMLGQSHEAVVGTRFVELFPQLPLTGVAEGVPLADVVIGVRRYSPRLRSIPTSADITRTYAFRDVTDARRLEARQLDFYSIIAHDLRTPLSSIMLRTALLLQGTHGDLADKHASELGKVQGSVRQLTELLNDFLDLAKMEGSGIHLERGRVDLLEVVHAAVADAEPVASSKRITIVVDPAATTTIVIGDRRRLGQVLSNLVSNALKFTDEGGAVTLRLASTTDGAKLRVEDTGRGLTPASRDRLFQRYARADEVKDIAGTGLGLMIVREIIEAHGGSVGVESELGKGSTFWFSVPWG
ncbi:MAG: ATP-binding protein [Polyangia bacterium]